MIAFGKAAVAAAEAAWVPERVHEVGKVPASPATPYSVVSVSSGSADNYGLCGAHGSRGYRIIVQAVGASANEVGMAVENADEAFLDKRLTVAGYDTTPATAEVASPIIRDPDGGALLSVTLTYTFHAYPTA